MENGKYYTKMESVERKMESVERKMESVEKKKEIVIKEKQKVLKRKWKVLKGKRKVLKRKCKVLKATNCLDLSCHETKNISLQLIVKTGFHFYLILSILQLEKKKY